MNSDLHLQESNQPLLLRALTGREVERPPVWMMRQAGRYMKVYISLYRKRKANEEVHCMAVYWSGAIASMCATAKSKDEFLGICSDSFCCETAGAAEAVPCTMRNMRTCLLRANHVYIVCSRTWSFVKSILPSERDQRTQI